MSASFGSVAAFVLTILLNGLWQAAVLAGAAWLVLRVAKGANATTRHAVLVAALIGALVLPVVTTAIALTPHAPPPTIAVTTHAHSSAALPQPVAQRAAAQHPAPSRPDTATMSTAVAAAVPAWRRLHLTLPVLLVAIVIGLWALCALALLVRLAFSLLYLERLKRDALPLGVDYRERLERWAAIGKGDRDVRLCRSPEINVPIAVGIFDAMILIPDRLLEELPAEDVDRVLLHELAHLRRADDWFNAFERVTEALLFFNPAVRWIVRQLDVEREVACDDWVLERRSEALPYAQCLVNLVQGTAWPHRPMVAPGVFITRRSISIRIERLLLKQRDVRRRVALGPLAAVTAIAAATCVAGAYAAPSIASSVSAPAASHLATTKRGSAGWMPPRTASKKPVTVAQNVRKSATEPTPAPTESATSAPSPTPSPLPTSAPMLAARPRPSVAPAPGGQGAFRQTYEMRTQTITRTVTPPPASLAQATEAAASEPVPSPAATAKVIADADYIAEMAAAGYPNLTVDQLVQLKNMGVDPAYVREVQGLGFGKPSVEQLVRLRAIGVSAQYVHDMHSLFPNTKLDDIIEMRAVGVTPSYVSDLKSAGVTNLSADSVRSMRAVGVSSKYVSDMRAAGVGPLNSEALHSMRAVGVDPAFVKEMSAAGYSHLSPETLTQVRAVGIDSAFLKTVQTHGFHNLSLEQLIQLKTSGVL